MEHRASPLNSLCCACCRPVQYEGVVSVDLAEQPYSLPPDGLGQLYDYLAERKCIEIPRNAIRSALCVGVHLVHVH